MLPARFWGRVQKTKTCWNWTGGTLHFGYGAYWHEGRNCRAHRMSWIDANGPIPEGAFICHKCDNPRCVNPRHLFLGDFAANMRDMVSKSRQHRPVGDLHHNRKLSAVQAAAIKRRIAEGERPFLLAREFDVHKNTIYSIQRGRSWRGA